MGYASLEDPTGPGRAGGHPARILAFAKNARNIFRCTISKMDAKKYTYHVMWLKQDQQHIGLCSQFPSLRHLDNAPEKALSGITKLVEIVLADMEKNKEEIPSPSTSADLFLFGFSATISSALENLFVSGLEADLKRLSSEAQQKIQEIIEKLKSS